MLPDATGVEKTSPSTETNRPDDCRCQPDDGLHCWPCHRAGHTTINPDASQENA